VATPYQRWVRAVRGVGNWKSRESELAQKSELGNRKEKNDENRNSDPLLLPIEGCNIGIPLNSHQKWPKRSTALNIWADKVNSKSRSLSAPFWLIWVFQWNFIPCPLITTIIRPNPSKSPLIASKKYLLMCQIYNFFRLFHPLTLIRGKLYHNLILLNNTKSPPSFYLLAFLLHKVGNADVISVSFHYYLKGKLNNYCPYIISPLNSTTKGITVFRAALR